LVYRLPRKRLFLPEAVEKERLATEAAERLEAENKRLATEEKRLEAENAQLTKGD
jgi:cell division protein FtsB